jgi:hypothetical protein
MNKTKSIIMSLSAVVIVTAFLLFIAMPPQVKAENDHSMHQGHMETKGTVDTLEAIHSQKLPMLSHSIEKAIQAITSGDDKAALSELLKAQESVDTIEQALGKHIEPQFANTKCPIMGSPINPEKVSDNLIRDYKGQKVAFCCGGCPATWDKLSDAEKESKLTKVKPQTQSHKHDH